MWGLSARIFQSQTEVQQGLRVHSVTQVFDTAPPRELPQMLEAFVTIPQNAVVEASWWVSAGKASMKARFHEIDVIS